jgi:hypothetical protein
VQSEDGQKIEGQNKLNRERPEPDPRAGGDGREGVCVGGPRWGLGLAEVRGLPVEQEYADEQQK